MPNNEIKSNCDNLCAFHKERDELIHNIESQINDSIGPSVNQHKAYWKFFFWGAGLSVSILVALVWNIRTSVNDIKESSIRIERSVAMGEIDHENNVRRLDGVESKVESLDNRIRDIEVKVSRRD